MPEQTYKTMNEKLKPGSKLIAETLEKMERLRAAETGGAKPNRRPLRAKRIVTVAAACVLVMALSVTALAAALPGFREMLFGKGSPVADSLMPVMAEGEQDGIRLEVLGAMGDKSNIVAYFTLQDRDGLNRLSGDLSVVASAKLNNEYPEREDVQDDGMAYHTCVLDYDEETQTAFCRFEMAAGVLYPDYPENQSDSQPYNAANADIRLRIRKIATESETFDYLPIEFTTEDLTTETLPVARVHHDVVRSEKEGVFETIPGFCTVEEAEADDAEMRAQMEEQGQDYFSLPIFEYCRDENGSPVVLKPGEPISPAGADFIRVTAVGFIDGKLHVQYRENVYRQNSENQNFNLVCADAGQGRAVAEQLASRHPDEIMAAADNELRMYKYLQTGSSFDFDEEGHVQWGAYYAAVRDQAGYRYREEVYDIGPEELEDYEFFAYASRSSNRLTDITAEFSLAENLPESTASFGPIETEDIAIAAMDVTPMGVYLTGTRKGMQNIDSLEFICKGRRCSYHAVGSRGTYVNSATTRFEDSAASIKLMADNAPVDPREITAVRINGREIPLA